MQAVGSYKGREMLFLGLGTGLGSTIIVDGIIEPVALGHLPYKKRTLRGLRRTTRFGTHGQDRMAA